MRRLDEWFENSIQLKNCTCWPQLASCLDVHKALLQTGATCSRLADGRWIASVDGKTSIGESLGEALFPHWLATHHLTLQCRESATQPSQTPSMADEASAIHLLRLSTKPPEAISTKKKGKARVQAEANWRTKP